MITKNHNKKFIFEMDLNPGFFMEIVLFLGIVILSATVLSMSIIFFMDHFIEPVHFLIFKKLVYVYFHPILKKLTPAQKRILETEVVFYRRLSNFSFFSTIKGLRVIKLREKLAIQLFY